MPRISDGTYNLPLPDVVSGTTISSSWANTTMDDIAQALTESLDRAGRGGMQAPFQFDDGTQSLPGATWEAEPSTGFYRAGLADLRTTVLGTDLMRWNGGATPPVVQVWADDPSSPGTDIWQNVLYGTATSSGTVPGGTADWQSLAWNNDAGVQAWVANSAWIIDASTGDSTAQRNVFAVAFVEDGTSLSSKYALQTIQAFAGTGLVGGGSLAADFTYSLDLFSSYNTDHSLVSVTGGLGLTGGGTIDFSQQISLDTANSRNVDHNAVNMIAGLGISGGGTIETSRSFNVGQGTGIVVGTDDVSLDITYTDGRYLGINDTAANSELVDGYSIAVQPGPAGNDPNTIYFLTS